MSVLVFNDARIEVNSVVLADHGAQVTIDYGAEMKDVTAFGDVVRKSKAGLKIPTVDAVFLQDYAGGSVDATLFGLVGAAAFPIKVRPTSAAISPTNPEFQASAVLESYQPVSGNVGDELRTRARFRCTTDITRATA